MTQVNQDLGSPLTYMQPPGLYPIVIPGIEFPALTYSSGSFQAGRPGMEA